jgi:hypothetical protein
LCGGDGLTGIDARIHRLRSDRPPRRGPGRTNRPRFHRASRTIRSIGTVRPPRAISQPGAVAQSGTLRLARLGDSRLSGCHRSDGCHRLTGINSRIDGLCRSDGLPGIRAIPAANHPRLTRTARPIGTVWAVGTSRAVSQSGTLRLAGLGDSRLSGCHRSDGCHRLTGINSRIDGLCRSDGLPGIRAIPAANHPRLTWAAGPIGTVWAIGTSRAVSQSGTIAWTGTLGLSGLGNPRLDRQSWLRGQRRLGGNDPRVHWIDRLPRRGAVQAAQVARTGAIARESSRRTPQPGLTGRSPRIDRVLGSGTGLRLKRRLGGLGRAYRWLRHGARLRLRSGSRRRLRGRARLRLGCGASRGLWGGARLRLRSGPRGRLRSGSRRRLRGRARLRLGCGTRLTAPPARGPVSITPTGTVARTLGRRLGNRPHQHAQQAHGHEQPCAVLSRTEPVNHHGLSLSREGSSGPTSWTTDCAWYIWAGWLAGRLAGRSLRAGRATLGLHPTLAAALHSPHHPRHPVQPTALPPAAPAKPTAGAEGNLCFTWGTS